MARTGRQTPTRSVTIEYAQTKGAEAVRLYNATGRTAQEWQEKQMDAILGMNEDGLWVHTKYGLAVPRRNGKNEVIVMRELYGLEVGERMCHTAHRTSTSHSSFERLYKLLRDAGYTECTRKKKEMPDHSFFASKQYGLECIELTGGGTIHFRTRTNNGGLGEGFDLLVIDEAQEYTEKQEAALIYTVTDSKNPQTIFTGTPPTAISQGNVFPELRDSILGGEGVDSGWAEWSIDELTEDIHNTDLWYETNPSLGTILTERNVRAEIRGDVVDFNIQRLGVWLRYSQKSVFSPAEWEELTDTPELEEYRYIGIKYGRNDVNVSMSIASKTKDGRVFVEAIDCMPIRSGNYWMMEFLKNPHIRGVVVDGANGKDLLSDQMKAEKLKLPIMIKTGEFVTACSMFENGVCTGQICHSAQPSLAQSITNCEKRPIGSGGGFGFQSLNDAVDVTLIESTVLAYWLCAVSKPPKKQRVSY